MAGDQSDIHHADYEKIACLIFCVLSPSFVFVRFWSRILAKQLGMDDWAALGALIMALASNIQTLVAISNGWGRHRVNLTAKQLRIVLILHWTFQITYKLTVALNKTSILLLYLRIMPQRLYRLSIYTLLTLVSLFALSTTIAGIFQCVPVEKAWIKKKPGYCYNLVQAWYANAIFSIITDIFILFLPLWMVHKLQRAQREKILLYGVFALGAFVTFTSIMRMFALKSASNPDTTYDVNSGFWSVIEINVGVICICLPPLRALIVQYLPTITSSSRPTVGSGRSGRSGRLGSENQNVMYPHIYNQGSAVHNTVIGSEGEESRRRLKGKVRGLNSVGGGDSSEEELFGLQDLRISRGGGVVGIGGRGEKGGIVETREVRMTIRGVGSLDGNSDGGEIELGS